MSLQARSGRTMFEGYRELAVQTSDKTIQQEPHHTSFSVTLSLSLTAGDFLVGFGVTCCLFSCSSMAELLQ
jgi:hypothetical protein